MGVLQKDSALQQVTDMAFGLTPQEQSLLLGRLYDHLESQGLDAEHEAAWSAEIERRVREVENGEVELIDHEVVMEKMRERFGPR
jgi:putative addiction module component (TIGR02574 family)